MVNQGHAEDAEDMVPTPHGSRIRRVQARVLHTTGGSTVENEGEKALIMSTADGSQLRKVTFQGANVTKALGSDPKMGRNGSRVVFDASRSYIENKITNDMLWLRESDGVYVVDMVVRQQRPEEYTVFLEKVHVAWPVSPHDST